MSKERGRMHVNKRWIAALSMLVLVFSFSNCEKSSVAPAQIVLPAVVSYSEEIQPIFDVCCTMSGCHSYNGTQSGGSGFGDRGKVDLSPSNSYKQLFNRGLIDTLNPSNSQIFNELNKPMPPWGRLVQYDYDLILKWIQQGAKNN